MSSLANMNAFLGRHPLTRDNKASAWRRLVWWQVRSRMSQEVIVNWIGGAKLAVRRGMVGATGNIYAGLHEFEDMMILLHFLRPGDLFLDIGANIGSFTVLASKVAGARAWAFEPDPQTAKLLQRNIEVNAIMDSAKVFVTALGEENGSITFTTGRDSMNRVAQAGDANTQTVKICRLDDVVGEEQPAMIKLDVEGHEESVVRGGDGVLERPSLKIVELETLSPTVIGTMKRHGFIRGFYDPFTRTLTTEERPDGGSNALFIRDWTMVSARLRDAAPIKVLDHTI
jgi:FkbM family methyltransferase